MEKRRTYSREFKIAAVKKVISRALTLVARPLGLA